MNYANINVSVDITLENGTKLTGVTEGSTVSDLCYHTAHGEEETVNGTIVSFRLQKPSPNVIKSHIYDGVAIGGYKPIPTCTIIPPVETLYKADLIVIEDEDGKHHHINVNNIISIGGMEVSENPEKSSITVGTSPIYADLTKVLETVEDGQALKLEAGEYKEALTLTKSVKLSGTNAGIPQNVIKNEIASLSDEVKTSNLTNTVEVNDENAVIVFDGMVFTGDSHLTITNAKEVKIINCRFEGEKAYAAKSYLINGADTCTNLKLTIEGCYFGDSVSENGNRYYNGLELNSYLADGSSISNNYFSADMVSHNEINFYNTTENAIVTCNNNHFANNDGGIRIGMKGRPTSTIDINGTVVDEWDDGGAMTSLIIIQPYGKLTETFEGVTINIAKSSFDKAHAISKYCGSNDTQLTDEQLPTVYVDGVKMDSIPKYW